MHLFFTFSIDHVTLKIYLICSSRNSLVLIINYSSPSKNNLSFLKPPQNIRVLLKPRRRKELEVVHLSHITLAWV
jgi:hypothetical protein